MSFLCFALFITTGLALAIMARQWCKTCAPQDQGLRFIVREFRQVMGAASDLVIARAAPIRHRVRHFRNGMCFQVTIIALQKGPKPTWPRFSKALTWPTSTPSASSSWTKPFRSRSDCKTIADALHQATRSTSCCTCPRLHARSVCV